MNHSSILLRCAWICLVLASLVNCEAKPILAHIDDTSMRQRDTLSRTFSISTLQATFLALNAKQSLDPAMCSAINAHYTSLYDWVWLRGNGTQQRITQLTQLLETAHTHGLADYMQLMQHKVQKQTKLFTMDSVIYASLTNTQIATYELVLTQTYLRLVAALRYGAIDPFLVINHAPQSARPTAPRPKYPRYYASQTIRPDSAFYAEALAATDIVAFAKACVPASREYAWLRETLAHTIQSEYRMSLITNLERLRWHTSTDTLRQGKRVVVNLPAQMLETFDAEGQRTLRMKVCYGDLSHRTPLLVSHIHRADLNPNWTVPPSILNKEVAVRYVGNQDYFVRQRMRAYERATNKELPPESLTAEQWQSGKYRLTQTGGEGGALGRIVFRFNNNYSIYLHDTNNRSAFKRVRRDVSHGCIRVEQPYALARFLLSRPDSLREAHIAYTMGLDTLSQNKPSRTLHNVHYDDVPLFIDYYTAWPYSKDSVVYYPDVYGYDALIIRALSLW